MWYQFPLRDSLTVIHLLLETSQNVGHSPTTESLQFNVGAERHELRLVMHIMFLV